LKLNTFLAAYPWQIKKKVFIRKVIKILLTRIFGKNAENISILVVDMSLTNKVDASRAAAAITQTKAPNNFTMYLNYNHLTKKEQFLHTIAHELAHAKQYYTGILQELPDKVIYNNIIYPKTAIHFNVLPWQNRPWEIEADKIALKVIKQMTKEGVCP
jgi:hypothetical protein